MLLLTLFSLVALTASEIRSPAYKLTPSPASPAAPSTVSPARAAQLFWSYYSRPSLERAPLLASGYQRDSPAVWTGQEAGREWLGQDMLQLGSLTSISHGPRRRRELSQPEQLQRKFHDFLSAWPVKGGVGPPPPPDLTAQYQAHHAKFRAEAAAQQRTFSRPFCRHVCSIGDPAVPCCRRISQATSPIVLHKNYSETMKSCRFILWGRSFSHLSLKTG